MRRNLQHTSQPYCARRRLETAWRHDDQGVPPVAESCASLELACVCTWLRARMRASASSTVDAWCLLEASNTAVAHADMRQAGSKALYSQWRPVSGMASKGWKHQSYFNRGY